MWRGVGGRSVGQLPKYWRPTGPRFAVHLATNLYHPLMHNLWVPRLPRSQVGEKATKN